MLDPSADADGRIDKLVWICSHSSHKIDRRVQRGEGIMEGSGVGTMDGATEIRWTLGCSRDTQSRRLRRVAAGSGEQAEALRARLIAATVEVLADGSSPRLDRTRDARAAA
jgi:hypothetical protein